VRYLGGRSIGPVDDLTKRRECRNASHVLGSPFPMAVAAATAGAGGAGAGGEVAGGEGDGALPLCTAAAPKGNEGDAAGQAQPDEPVEPAGRGYGYWAKRPPARDGDEQCPAVCDWSPSEFPDAKCSLNYTTPPGPCALRDTMPVYSGWHAAHGWPEPALTGHEWREARCRYRLLTAADVRQCVERRGLAVIMTQPSDVFGDLLERFELGRSGQWCRGQWCEGFAYEPGAPAAAAGALDLLLPSDDMEVGTLMKHLSLLRNLTVGAGAEGARAAGAAGTGSGAPVVAVVVMLWPAIKAHIQTHEFSEDGFLRELDETLERWVEARAGGALDPRSTFVLVLAPAVHEWVFPYTTMEAVQKFNELARAKVRAHDAVWRRVVPCRLMFVVFREFCMLLTRVIFCC
jgi:hypothetical protein